MTYPRATLSRLLIHLCPSLSAICHVLSFYMLSVISATSLHAQSTNGLVTVRQDTFLAGGGRVGTGQPVDAMTLLGESSGGRMQGSTVTVRIGSGTKIPPLPAGTRMIRVEGTIDDSNAVIAVNGIPASITATTFHSDNVPIVEGPNTITATAIDQVGNQGSISITVYLDTHPPARPTIATLPLFTDQASYTLTGTKTTGTSIWINGVEVVALNDETTWIATVSLQEGDNTFTVIAKDAAGNASTPNVATIVLDTLPAVISNLVFSDPQGQILLLDASTQLPKTNFSTVTLQGQVDDSLTQVSANGVVAQRSGLNFVGTVSLVVGNNRIEIVATSPRGFITTETLNVIRGTIPAITHLQPADATILYVDSSPTLQASATDQENDPIQYQILLNGQVMKDWNMLSSISWIPGLTDRGSRWFEVRVRDGFGGQATQQSEVYVVRPGVVPQ